MDMDVLEQYGELDKIGQPEALDNKEEKPQPAAVSANNFYGNKPQPAQPQQQQQQQQRSLPHHQSNPSTTAHPHLYPIESLSPYAHKWTIRARCTHKGELKTWHNTKGEGKLFSVNLLDDTGEIRATGFNDVCERLYPMFEEGTVYYISAPCRVTLAKKQFSNLPNDYELQFERDTEVEKVCDTSLILLLISFLTEPRPRIKIMLHRSGTISPKLVNWIRLRKRRPLTQSACSRRSPK
jgi:replication factor A1